MASLVKKALHMAKEGTTTGPPSSYAPPGDAVDEPERSRRRSLADDETRSQRRWKTRSWDPHRGNVAELDFEPVDTDLSELSQDIAKVSVADDGYDDGSDAATGGSGERRRPRRSTEKPLPPLPPRNHGGAPPPLPPRDYGTTVQQKSLRRSPAKLPLSHGATPGETGGSVPRKPVSGRAPYSIAPSDQLDGSASDVPSTFVQSTSGQSSAANVTHQHPHSSGQEILMERTAETLVHERVAPAVTHETIRREIHESLEENIVKEIHTHEVHHRVLPVIDVEILPPRHFVPGPNGVLVEVPEDQLPGRHPGGKRNWVITQVPPDAGGGQKTRSPLPLAASSEVTERDYRTYVTPDGVEHSERTLVHPPVIDDGQKPLDQTISTQFD